VQRSPALEELFGEFGVFVQGGIEEALVGGEDDDECELDYRAEEETVGQPQPLKKREIHRSQRGARRWGGVPLFATRRTKNVRRKKPGRCVRNDGWGGTALCRS